MPSPEEWLRIKSVLEQLPEGMCSDDPAVAERCGGDGDLLRWVRSALAEPAVTDDPFERSGGPPLEALSEVLAGPAGGPRGLEEGSRIGRYRILRLLATGGMGITYLAERADGAFDRTVALKVGRRLFGPEGRERQLREVSILARLHHPHIVPLMDAGLTPEGYPYLVMEFIDGVPLTTYCDARHLGVSERLHLFDDLLAALEHAHRNLVVHQDIKPSNILVTEEGILRLLDFGIARVLTPTGAVGGGGSAYTPAYAAPEQVRGEPVTTATDVFGCGVLLHELLTGRRPLSRRGSRPAAGGRAVPDAAADRPANRLSADADRHAGPAPRHVPADLLAVVERALAPEPDARYPSVEALRSDLTAWRRGRPVSVYAERRGYRAGKFVRRNARVVGAIALAVVTLLGGLGATVWQARQAAAEAARAEAVTAFVLTLFESTDPDRSGTSEVRAQDLLRRSVPRIDQELAGQPLLQAELWMVVADAFQRLGNYQDALPLVERALERRRALQGPVHADIAESLSRLSRLYYLRSDFTAAEAPLLDALAMQSTLFGTRHPAVATSQDNLAELRRVEGELDIADSMATMALATRRALLGPVHTEIGWSLNNLAVIRRAQGRLEDARALFEESLAMKRQLFGPAHSEILITTNNLGNVLRLQGSFDEAVEVYRAVVDTVLEVFGEGHPTTTTTLNNLAVTLFQAGRAEEAQSMFRRTLASWEARGELEHTNAVATRNNLASVLLSLGHTEEAIATARQAAESWARLHGPTDRRVGVALVTLALALEEKGDSGEAMGALSRATEIAETLPFSDPARARVAGALAAHYAKDGRCDEARSRVAELLVDPKSSPADDPVHTVLAAAGCASGGPTSATP
ncbi:MAG: serine/threonine-protein kinase [Gemmatimonadota bacterium]